MTDTHADTAGNEAAPVGDIDFDSEFASFLGHDFSAPHESLDKVEEAPAPKEGEEGYVAPDPAKEPEGDKSAGNAEPAAPAPKAEPQPQEGVTTGAQALVDAADLAAMQGLTNPVKAAPVAAPQGDPVPGKTTPAGQEEETWAPFTPDFKLDTALRSALFESEDTDTREKALVGLLASFGNTLTTIFDQRMKAHYAPQMQSHFVGSVESRQIYSSIQSDFHNEFPELKDYGPAVKKAFEVVAAKDPAAPYSPELRNKVGELARAAIAQSGVTLPTRKGAAAPAPAKPTPQRKTPPAAIFDAGGARPGGSVEKNSPLDIVTQLSEF